MNSTTANSRPKLLRLLANRHNIISRSVSFLLATRRRRATPRLFIRTTCSKSTAFLTAAKSATRQRPYFRCPYRQQRRRPLARRLHRLRHRHRRRLRRRRCRRQNRQRFPSISTSCQQAPHKHTLNNLLAPINPPRQSPLRSSSNINNKSFNNNNYNNNNNNSSSNKKSNNNLRRWQTHANF